jgi:hypothetical protein
MYERFENIFGKNPISMDQTMDQAMELEESFLISDVQNLCETWRIERVILYILI